MFFADLHCHGLFEVDDGATSEETMHAMLDAAYADGTRYLCFTPHFHLGYFGNNTKARDAAFSNAEKYVNIRHPDLKICLGNELRYSRECISWLEEGLCLTLNGTNYVLVDFSESERAKTIVDGVNRILNAGYIPVLAHAERYDGLNANTKDIQSFHQDGVLVQVDSQSLLGGFGAAAKRRAKAMIRQNLVDFISTDAHDMRRRPPEMSEAFLYLERKFGRTYAERLCKDNALQLLWQGAEGKKQNGYNKE